MLRWGGAVKAFVYVMNRMPNSSNPGGVSSYEMEHSRNPDNSHFVEWGATVHSHLPHDGREVARPESLDAAAEVGIMVGYSTNTKGYRIYFPERGNKNQNGNILVRRPLKFFPPGTAPPEEGDERFRRRRAIEMRDANEMKLKSSTSETETPDSSLQVEKDMTTTTEEERDMSNAR